MYIDEDAVGTDDDVAAGHSHVFFAVHAFFVPHTICLTDRVIGIGEERERQVELLFELGMGCDRIGANPIDNRIGSSDLCIPITEPTGLCRTPRGVVFGLKVQHHGAAPQRREFDRVAGVVEEAEGRGECANRKGSHGFLHLSGDSCTMW